MARDSISYGQSASPVQSSPVHHIRIIHSLTLPISEYRPKIELAKTFGQQLWDMCQLFDNWSIVVGLWFWFQGCWFVVSSVSIFYVFPSVFVLYLWHCETLCSTFSSPPPSPKHSLIYVCMYIHLTYSNVYANLIPSNVTMTLPLSQSVYVRPEGKAKQTKNTSTLWLLSAIL